MVGRGTSSGRLKRPPSQAVPPASHPPPCARTRTEPGGADEQPSSQPGVAEQLRTMAAQLQSLDSRIVKLEKAFSELGGGKDHLLDELSDIRRTIHLTQVTSAATI